MSSNDQRATERFTCEAPVVIEDSQTGKKYDGSMYNYSRGGMYVELDHPLNPGSEIRILIERVQKNKQPESCRAKTIWCKEIPGAVVLYDYGIGVRYDLDANSSNQSKKFHVIDGGVRKDS
jgi:Tfp pilus assembly protein PilZ